MSKVVAHFPTAGLKATKDQGHFARKPPKVCSRTVSKSLRPPRYEYARSRIVDSNRKTPPRHGLSFFHTALPSECTVKTLTEITRTGDLLSGLFRSCSQKEDGGAV